MGMSEQHPHPDTGEPHDDCVVCRLESRIDRLALANTRLLARIDGLEALIESARTVRVEEAQRNRRTYERLRAMPANGSAAPNEHVEALIMMSDEMVKARTAAEIAVDALRRAADDHGCDFCRADAAAIERALS